MLNTSTGSNGQRSFIRLYFRQLLRILLLIQACRLFLQLQFHDAVALRLQIPFGLHPRLFMLPQLLRKLVQLVPCIGQRTLLLAALFQQRLQAGLGGLVIEAFQFQMALLHVCKQLSCLFQCGSDIAFQFLNLAAMRFL